MEFHNNPRERIIGLVLFFALVVAVAAYAGYKLKDNGIMSGFSPPKDNAGLFWSRKPN